jgi:hypothetical protein
MLQPNLNLSNLISFNLQSSVYSKSLVLISSSPSTNPLLGNFKTEVFHRRKPPFSSHFELISPITHLTTLSTFNIHLPKPPFSLSGLHCFPTLLFVLRLFFQQSQSNLDSKAKTVVLALCSPCNNMNESDRINFTLLAYLLTMQYKQQTQRHFATLSINPKYLSHKPIYQNRITILSLRPRIS